MANKDGLVRIKVVPDTSGFEQALLKEAQKAAKNTIKQEVEYVFTGDDSQLKDIVDQIIKLESGSFSFSFDDSLFKKKFDNLTKYIDKEGKATGDAFSKAIKDALPQNAEELGKFSDISNILSKYIEGFNGKNTGTNISNAAVKIKQAIAEQTKTFDVSDINSVENMIQLYKEYATVVAVARRESEYGLKNVKFDKAVDLKTVGRDFEKLMRGINVGEMGETLRKAYENEYLLAKDFMSRIQNLFSGDFTGAGNMDKLIAEALAALEKYKAELVDVETEIQRLSGLDVADLQKSIAGVTRSIMGLSTDLGEDELAQAKENFVKNVKDLLAIRGKLGQIAGTTADDVRAALLSGFGTDFKDLQKEISTVTELENRTKNLMALISRAETQSKFTGNRGDARVPGTGGGGTGDGTGTGTGGTGTGSGGTGSGGTGGNDTPAEQNPPDSSGIKDFTEDINKLKEALSSLEGDVKTLGSNLESLNEVSKQKSVFAKIEQDIDGFVAKIEKIDTTIETLKGKLSAINMVKVDDKELSVFKKIGDEITQFKQDISEINEPLKNLKTELSGFKELAQGVPTAIKAIKGLPKELTDALQNAKAFDDFHNAFKQLKEEIETIRGSVETLFTDAPDSNIFTAINAQVQTLGHLVDTVKDRLADVEQKMYSMLKEYPIGKQEPKKTPAQAPKSESDLAAEQKRAAEATARLIAELEKEKQILATLDKHYERGEGDSRDQLKEIYKERRKALSEYKKLISQEADPGKNSDYLNAYFYANPNEIDLDDKAKKEFNRKKKDKILDEQKLINDMKLDELKSSLKDMVPDLVSKAGVDVTGEYLRKVVEAQQMIQRIKSRSKTKADEHLSSIGITPKTVEWIDKYVERIGNVKKLYDNWIQVRGAMTQEELLELDSPKKTEKKDTPEQGYIKEEESQLDSLKAKVEEVEAAIDKKSEAFGREAEAAKTAIDSEKGYFDNLIEKIDSVKTSIENKDAAFETGSKNLKSVVDADIAELDRIKNKMKEVYGDASPDIPASDITDGAKYTPEYIEKLTDAFSELREIRRKLKDSPDDVKALEERRDELVRDFPELSKIKGANLTEEFTAFRSLKNELSEAYKKANEMTEAHVAVSTKLQEIKNEADAVKRLGEVSQTATPLVQGFATANAALAGSVDGIASKLTAEADAIDRIAKSTNDFNGAIQNNGSPIVTPPVHTDPEEFDVKKTPEYFESEKYVNDLKNAIKVIAERNSWAQSGLLKNVEESDVLLKKFPELEPFKYSISGHPSEELFNNFISTLEKAHVYNEANGINKMSLNEKFSFDDRMAMDDALYRINHLRYDGKYINSDVKDIIQKKPNVIESASSMSSALKSKWKWITPYVSKVSHNSSISNIKSSDYEKVFEDTWKRFKELESLNDNDPYKKTEDFVVEQVSNLTKLKKIHSKIKPRDEYGHSMDLADYARATSKKLGINSNTTGIYSLEDTIAETLVAELKGLYDAKRYKKDMSQAKGLTDFVKYYNNNKDNIWKANRYQYFDDKINVLSGYIRSDVRDANWTTYAGTGDPKDFSNRVNRITDYLNSIERHKLAKSILSGDSYTPVNFDAEMFFRQFEETGKISIDDMYKKLRQEPINVEGAPEGATSSLSSESEAIQKVGNAAKDASSHVESFATANEKVASSVGESATLLTNEATAIEKINGISENAGTNVGNFATANKNIVDGIGGVSEILTNEATAIDKVAQSAKDAQSVIDAIAKSPLKPTDSYNSSNEDVKKELTKTISKMDNDISISSIFAGVKRVTNKGYAELAEKLNQREKLKYQLAQLNNEEYQQLSFTPESLKKYRKEYGTIGKPDDEKLRKFGTPVEMSKTEDVDISGIIGKYKTLTDTISALKAALAGFDGSKLSSIATDVNIEGLAGSVENYGKLAEKLEALKAAVKDLDVSNLSTVNESIGKVQKLDTITADYNGFAESLGKLKAALDAFGNPAPIVETINSSLSTAIKAEENEFDKLAQSINGVIEARKKFLDPNYDGEKSEEELKKAQEKAEQAAKEAERTRKRRSKKQVEGQMTLEDMFPNYEKTDEDPVKKAEKVVDNEIDTLTTKYANLSTAIHNASEKIQSFITAHSGVSNVITTALSDVDTEFKVFKDFSDKLDAITKARNEFVKQQQEIVKIPDGKKAKNKDDGKVETLNDHVDANKKSKDDEKLNTSVNAIAKLGDDYGNAAEKITSAASALGTFKANNDLATESAKQASDDLDREAKAFKKIAKNIKKVSDANEKADKKLKKEEKKSDKKTKKDVDKDDGKISNKNLSIVASDYEKVTSTIDKATESIQSFNTANEGVASSAQESLSFLQQEATVAKEIATHMEQAATAKKEFATANEEVLVSAQRSAAELIAESQAAKNVTYTLGADSEEYKNVISAIAKVNNQKDLTDVASIVHSSRYSKKDKKYLQSYQVKYNNGDSEVYGKNGTLLIGKDNVISMADSYKALNKNITDYYNIRKKIEKTTSEAEKAELKNKAADLLEQRRGIRENISLQKDSLGISDIDTAEDLRSRELMAAQRSEYHRIKYDKHFAEVKKAYEKQQKLDNELRHLDSTKDRPAYLAKEKELNDAKESYSRLKSSLERNFKNISGVDVGTAIKSMNDEVDALYNKIATTDLNTAYQKIFKEINSFEASNKDKSYFSSIISGIDKLKTALNADDLDMSKIEAIAKEWNNLQNQFSVGQQRDDDYKAGIANAASIYEEAMKTKRDRLALDPVKNKDEISRMKTEEGDGFSRFRQVKEDLKTQFPGRQTAIDINAAVKEVDAKYRTLIDNDKRNSIDKRVAQLANTIENYIKSLKSEGAATKDINKFNRILDSLKRLDTSQDAIDGVKIDDIIAATENEFFDSKRNYKDSKAHKQKIASDRAAQDRRVKTKKDDFKTRIAEMKRKYKGGNSEIQDSYISDVARRLGQRVDGMTSDYDIKNTEKAFRREQEVIKNTEKAIKKARADVKELKKVNGELYALEERANSGEDVTYQLAEKRAEAKRVKRKANRSVKRVTDSKSKYFGSTSYSVSRQIRADFETAQEKPGSVQDREYNKALKALKERYEKTKKLERSIASLDPDSNKKKLKNRKAEKRSADKEYSKAEADFISKFGDLGYKVDDAVKGMKKGLDAEFKSLIDNDAATIFDKQLNKMKQSLENFKKGLKGKSYFSELANDINQLISAVNKAKTIDDIKDVGKGLKRAQTKAERREDAAKQQKINDKEYEASLKELKAAYEKKKKLERSIASLDPVNDKNKLARRNVELFSANTAYNTAENDFKNKFGNLGYDAKTAVKNMQKELDDEFDNLMKSDSARKLDDEFKKVASSTDKLYKDFNKTVDAITAIQKQLVTGKYSGTEFDLKNELAQLEKQKKDYANQISQNKQFLGISGMTDDDVALFNHMKQSRRNVKSTRNYETLNQAVNDYKAVSDAIVNGDGDLFENLKDRAVLLSNIRTGLEDAVNRNLFNKKEDTAIKKLLKKIDEDFESSLLNDLEKETTTLNKLKSKNKDGKKDAAIRRQSQKVSDLTVTARNSERYMRGLNSTGLLPDDVLNSFSDRLSFITTGSISQALDDLEDKHRGKSYFDNLFHIGSHGSTENFKRSILNSTNAFMSLRSLEKDVEKYSDLEKLYGRLNGVVGNIYETRENIEKGLATQNDLDNAQREQRNILSEINRYEQQGYAIPSLADDYRRRVQDEAVDYGRRQRISGINERIKDLAEIDKQIRSNNNSDNDIAQMVANRTAIRNDIEAQLNIMRNDGTLDGSLGNELNRRINDIDFSHHNAEYGRATDAIDEYLRAVDRLTVLRARNAFHEIPDATVNDYLQEVDELRDAAIDAADIIEGMYGNNFITDNQIGDARNNILAAEERYADDYYYMNTPEYLNREHTQVRNQNRTNFNTELRRVEQAYRAAFDIAQMIGNANEVEAPLYYAGLEEEFNRRFAIYENMENDFRARFGNINQALLGYDIDEHLDQMYQNVANGYDSRNDLVTTQARRVQSMYDSLDRLENQHIDKIYYGNIGNTINALRGELNAISGTEGTAGFNVEIARITDEMENLLRVTRALSKLHGNEVIGDTIPDVQTATAAIEQYLQNSGYGNIVQPLRMTRQDGDFTAFAARLEDGNGMVRELTFNFSQLGQTATVEVREMGTAFDRELRHIREYLNATEHLNDLRVRNAFHEIPDATVNEYLQEVDRLRGIATNANNTINQMFNAQNITQAQYDDATRDFTRAENRYTPNYYVTSPAYLNRDHTQARNQNRADFNAELHRVQQAYRAAVDAAGALDSANAIESPLYYAGLEEAFNERFAFFENLDNAFRNRFGNMNQALLGYDVNAQLNQMYQDVDANYNLRDDLISNQARRLQTMYDSLGRLENQHIDKIYYGNIGNTIAALRGDLNALSGTEGTMGFENEIARIANEVEALLRMTRSLSKLHGNEIIGNAIPDIPAARAVIEQYLQNGAYGDVTEPLRMIRQDGDFAAFTAEVEDGNGMIRQLTFSFSQLGQTVAVEAREMGTEFEQQLRHIQRYATAVDNLNALMARNDFDDGRFTAEVERDAAALVQLRTEAVNAQDAIRRMYNGGNITQEEYDRGTNQFNEAEQHAAPGYYLTTHEYDAQDDRHTYAEMEERFRTLRANYRTAAESLRKYNVLNDDPTQDVALIHAALDAYEANDDAYQRALADFMRDFTPNANRLGYDLQARVDTMTTGVDEEFRNRTQADIILYEGKRIQSFYDTLDRIEQSHSGKVYFQSLSDSITQLRADVASLDALAPGARTRTMQIVDDHIRQFEIQAALLSRVHGGELVSQNPVASVVDARALATHYVNTHLINNGGGTIAAPLQIAKQDGDFTSFTARVRDADGAIRQLTFNYSQLGQVLSVETRQAGSIFNELLRDIQRFHQAANNLNNLRVRRDLVDGSIAPQVQVATQEFNNLQQAAAHAYATIENMYLNDIISEDQYDRATEVQNEAAIAANPIQYRNTPEYAHAYAARTQRNYRDDLRELERAYRDYYNVTREINKINALEEPIRVEGLIAKAEERLRRYEDLLQNFRNNFNLLSNGFGRNLNNDVDNMTATVDEEFARIINEDGIVMAANRIQGLYDVLDNAEKKHGERTYFQFLEDDINSIRKALADLPSITDPKDYDAELRRIEENIDRFSSRAAAASRLKGDRAVAEDVSTQEDARYAINGFLRNEGSLVKELRETGLANGVTKYAATIRDATGMVKEMQFSYSQMARGITVDTREVGVQLTGLSGFIDDVASKFSELTVYWVAELFDPYEIIQRVQQLISAIVDLDTALIDLQKTSSMSDVELNQFYSEATGHAKELGISTQEFIQQASDMSRSGFSTKEQATDMARYSAQFAAISPDIDTSEATTGLISIMKAFDVQSEDVLDGIISKVNALGNSFSETNGDILEGLERSSASMSAANNSLDETMALFTAGQEITQNAETVGEMICPQ